MMNAFLILFAGITLLERAVELGLTWLNLQYLRAHESQIPSVFREKISPEQYRKSITYNREKAWFGLISSWWDTLIFWFFLLNGYFESFDQWARSFRLGSILTGIAFMGIISVIFFLLSLPSSLYGTFVIEQKFGFNRMTWKIWIGDLLKGILLTLLLGVPVFSVVLWLMEHYLHGAWWLYVWGLILGVQVIVQAIFPVVIVPLFNRLTPLPEGELHRKILRLAERAKFRLSGIYTMDGSKRSTHSNAFFAGIGRFRRIILFDTLVSSLRETELLSVLAHEMGHSVHKHIRTNLVMGALTALAGLFILAWALPQPWFCASFQFTQSSSYAALFVFMRTAGPFVFFFSPLVSWLSRRHEYQADRYAAMAIADSEPMIQSLIKLTKDNLSNLTPHPLYSFFYYSHPTTLERIAALEKLELAPT